MQSESLFGEDKTRRVGARVAAIEILTILAESTEDRFLDVRKGS
jgi:hypothetical protein